MQTETTKHPQEQIVATFDCDGVAVDLVEWTDTIWCGKIGYAANHSDEPDVGKIMGGFIALDVPNSAVNGRLERGWDVCMSVNYLSKERPNGVMIGFLVDTERQPEGFDTRRVPAAQYMRIQMSDETAKALGREPFKGGIPPYEWIGEHTAPRFGYKYGDDTLPVFEYYYYDSEKKKHTMSYLYVPVAKATPDTSESTSTN